MRTGAANHLKTVGGCLKDLDHLYITSKCSLMLQKNIGIPPDLFVAATLFMLFIAFDDHDALSLFVPLIQVVDKNGRVHYSTIKRELARGQREAAIKKREKEDRRQWRRANPDLVWKEETEKLVDAFKGFCILVGIILLFHFPVVGFSLLGCSILVFLVYSHFKRKSAKGCTEQAQTVGPVSPKDIINRQTTKVDRTAELWHKIHTEKLTWNEKQALTKEYNSLVNGSSHNEQGQ